MTYQELLDEFNARVVRNLDTASDLHGADIRLLLWAMQQLIEKLRDEENLQKHQSFGPAIGLPYWKDR